MFSLYLGKVSGNTDEYHSGRIKAIIEPDKGRAYSEIPFAFPFLPKMLHVIPKNGEAVLVLVSNDKEAGSQRYYIGPVISQPNNMEYDAFSSFSATRALGGALRSMDTSPDNYSVSEGSLPEIPEEVAILGRKDTEVILSNDDVRIRAGARITNSADKTVKFNADGKPAYIKLKYYENPLKSAGTPDTHPTTESVAAVVADKVLLLSPSGDGLGNNWEAKINNKEGGIADEDMKTFVEKAHRLPYGDELCDFLSSFVQMFKQHRHPYDGMIPYTFDNATAAFDLKYDGSKADLENKLLSKDIAIN